jgi:hypothetical protein
VKREEASGKSAEYLIILEVGFYLFRAKAEDGICVAKWSQITELIVGNLSFD